MSENTQPKHGTPLQVSVGRIDVRGQVHAWQGHDSARIICMHIHQPFGECAAFGPRDEIRNHDTLLRRLFDVCLWAEHRANELSETDRQLLAELGDPLESVDPRREALWDLRTSEVAQSMGCPWPQVAASAWLNLAAHAFYANGRYAETVRSPL